MRRVVACVCTSYLYMYVIFIYERGGGGVLGGWGLPTPPWHQSVGGTGAGGVGDPAGACLRDMSVCRFIRVKLSVSPPPPLNAFSP